ncbi:Phage P22-like portal protein [Pseudomonas sp. NFPP05]|uniref:portal protein n=1 Tax=unclassified Pseudomonas TaxID=196821 RepID=UPI00088D4A65|nr:MULTISPECIES: portal protein [unclassified Pseudomonas]SDA11170.1 Phage P22-like portal protein [Pseudomonas sp. NFPP12]SFM12213.1 Phage P22-like portal protein [Pseudomonas sp. NFPP05]
MLTLTRLKELHDKAYCHGQTTRLRAADDMMFYHITQWDDSTLGESSLQYRGQFDVLRKAGRQIMADLRANPVQVNFVPKSESRDDGADILDGLYLTDDRANTSLEAYDNATGEAVVCGVGAWELYTRYATNRAGDNRQIIERRPIYEANNNCFWDPNAKRLDKSDAKYVSILNAYSPGGYDDLVEELCRESGKPSKKKREDEECEDEDETPSSFASPEQSYTFPWMGSGNDIVYVVCFYHRRRIKDKVITLTDPLGQTVMYRESDLVDLMDELIDDGYVIESERDIERWEVRKYIASGEKILNGKMGKDGEREGEVIAGENIPVIPTYGERAFIEGEEHYEGITRLAKDPQRLRNFQLSYLADIVSRSPRPKPIFNPEQVQGYEFMYEENGADSNYPYLLQNRFDGNNQALPIGPVAVMPEQTIPQALMASIELSRQAVEDVANPGLPQDIADPDLSGKAVNALTNRLDQQSIVYQQNLKHAKRRDAEVYASMAVEVYDAPREVTLTSPDGTTKKVKIMEAVLDRQTGELVALNDLTNTEYDVYADIGPSYSSKKEQTIDQLSQMATSMAPIDPMMAKMLMLQTLTLINGVDMDPVRKYARKQLILAGIFEPETEEEEAMLQEAQNQQQPPSADMVLAQAEMEKARASQMDTQRKALNDQQTAQNNSAKVQVDMFRAETDRAAVQVDAQVAGADIQFKQARTAGQVMENVQRLVSPYRATVQPRQ